MEEFEGLLLIKEKYRKGRSYLIKEFTKEEAVRLFLEKTIIETNSIRKLKILNEHNIRINFNNSGVFFEHLKIPFIKLRNFKTLKFVPIEKVEKVWSRDKGWISVNDLPTVITKLDIFVYKNLIDNYSSKYGNFDIFEFFKIKGLSIRGERSCLSIFDIYKSCDFSPPQFCPITKNKIDWKIFGKSWNKNSPTLDRIIPSKGYVQNNIKIMSHFGNSLKGSHDTETLKNTIEYLENCG